MSEKREVDLGCFPYVLITVLVFILEALLEIKDAILHGGGIP